MRRIAIVVALFSSISLLSAAAVAATPAGAGGGAGGGAIVDPRLQRQMAAAGADGMVDAVIVLDAQADLSAVQATGRKQRLADVERVLRAKASSSQTGIMAALEAAAAKGLVARVTPLWIFNGIGVRATPDVIAGLAARSDVEAIQADAAVAAPAAVAQATSAAPGPNISKINAPALWALGFTGQGIVVANMDTGVDVSHPDLASRWRGGTNSWFDPYGEHPTTPTDVNGHGTWTMGTMVGGDAGGTSIGVAPDARWIAVKMFPDHGNATTTAVHQGFQWLLDPDHNPATPDAPNVVNNSWQSGTGCTLTFQLDLQALRAAGILPVFAAGNFGPSANTSAAPANNPEAFAVGGTTNADAIDYSSSRGPSACGQTLFPELTAPGVSVRTSDLFGGYANKSGTSMAAPNVSGALALLLQAHPGLPVAQQEAALEAGAVDLGTAGPDNTFGYGRLDVLAAYNSLSSSADFTLGASPSSASTPPGGSVSYTVTVTGSNGFAGDVSLSLSGLSGSQASWTFTPGVVTGGSGTAQLDVTASSALAPGSYPVTITGTSGSLVRNAPATLVVQPPPDFSIAASPSSATVQAGGSASYTVAVASSNGFTGDVSLSMTGLSGSQGGGAFTPAFVTGGSGTAQLDVTTDPTLAPGTYPLTITGTSGSIVRSASATLVVGPPPDFSLASSPASASTTPGGSVSYTVTVSGANGFSGDVSLSLSGLSGSQGSGTFTPAFVTGGSGTAQLVVTTDPSLAPGTYPLTISGTSGSITHTSGATLIVSPPPDFTVGASPGSVSVQRGANASYTVTISGVNGFTSDVSLSLSGLAGSVGTSGFAPSVVTGGSGTAQLTITTSASAAAGTYPLTVVATAGAIVHSVPVTLVVTTAPAPDFSLSVTPTSATVARGQSGSYLVSVGRIGSFTGSVSLSVSGVPSRATASFSRTTVTPPGTSTLTIRVNSRTPVGTYTLTIRGAKGALVHQVTVTLVVT